MLRITKVRSAARASQYFEKDDYYADGKSPSQWLGKGAETLGLAGAVDRETFQRLLAGEMPNG
ncbi:MAG: relaxase domain-containing protein, partial [Patescibacteria group bacterium]